LLLLLAPTSLVAQSIRLVSRVPVNLDLPGRPLGEPHLAVHPTNDRHLLGAASGDSTVRRKVMAMAVDSRGVVGVAYVESGRNPAGPCAEDVYFAASVDGGHSFLPRQPIASEPACATATTNGSGFHGDYFGLATDGRGQFRRLWSSVRERLLELQLATIEVTGAPRSR
jgi:hypothetical protein